METSVSFDSELFAPFLPEDAQVNPRVYGAELAFWLARQLAARGVVTSYPNYEDWGWFIEYRTDAGDEYWLCCGNREGAQDQWLCFLDAKARRCFGRSKPPPESAAALLEALRAILDATPEIVNIVWSDEEYGV